MGERSTHRIGPEPVRLPVALAMALVFDEHDVLANRRGQLSRWQRQRLDSGERIGRRRITMWMTSRRRNRPRQMHQPVVVASVGVPVVSPGPTPGVWQVQVGHVRFDLDGGTVARLDTTETLRAYTAVLGATSPALLSAEVVDGHHPGC